MNRQLNRPSPSHSATQFPVGHVMKGNDGRMWEIKANSAGIQRWVPAGGNVSTVANTVLDLDALEAEIKQVITQPKPLKMAKSTKTITKKTTQEVRQIETSLINKEEVFKMLALAEATGLPLLLVGEPGVNSK